MVQVYKMKNILENKKGQTGGLITGLVMGIASLVIGIIIALVIVTTLTGANLLDTGTLYLNKTVGNLSANYSEGINNISSKLPTVLLVAAIVLILGVLAVLVGVWNRMRGGGTSI